MPDTNAAPAEDSIGADLRAAFEKHAEPAVAAEAGAIAKPEVAAAPAADKVVEKPVEAPAAEVKSDPTKPAAEAVAADQAAAEARGRADRIPLGWKGGAAAWHAQSPDVKQYVADTIANASKKIEQQAPAVKFAQEVASVFRPHEGFLRTQGANAVQATQYLMDGYVTLMTGTPAQKYQVIQNLASQAGIDLASIQAGEAPKVDPEVAALREQVQRMAAHMQNQHQTAQGAEQAQLATELQTFESDPAHEHFQLVRGEMAALLMAGQAKDLQEAYDKACWARPEIRSSLVNKQIAQETEKRKKEAEQAQRAGVSITGAPSTGSGSPSLGDMSLRESLEHQFRTAARV